MEPQPDKLNASKASQKGITPKPTFSRSMSLHTYTCGRAQRGDRTAEDGGRQNEVLLRTLKRTRLAQRVHVWICKLKWISTVDYRKEGGVPP